MTIISNSDIETAQKCERMFYYSRMYGGGGIRPKQLPVALKRGSFGHKMMEKGFESIVEGGGLEEACLAAGVILEELMKSGDPDTPDMMKVYRHVCAFFDYALSDKCAWRPVAIEERGMWNLTTNLPMTKEEAMLAEEDRIFGYTPDLIVEFVSGLFKGQHAVLDYKFLGQYMKENAITMSQQIPKYCIYRNKTHTDFKIRRGAFIQLNTSAAVGDSGHKLFLIKWVEPTAEEFKQIEEENEILVHRTAELYEDKDRRFLRTVNKDVCNWCFFANDICPMERNGKDITKTVERVYIPNDYGYNNAN